MENIEERIEKLEAIVTALVEDMERSYETVSHATLVINHKHNYPINSWPNLKTKEVLKYLSHDAQ